MLPSVRAEARKLVSRLRRMRLRVPDTTDRPQDQLKSILGIDVAKELRSVIPATRFTLVAFLVALLATGIAVLLPTIPRRWHSGARSWRSFSRGRPSVQASTKEKRTGYVALVARVSSGGRGRLFQSL